MALHIMENCTVCDACVIECTNEAIAEADPVYVIDAFKCTECVGAHDEPQCQLVCPVDECIVPNPEFVESKEQLQEKYEQLNG